MIIKPILLGNTPLEREELAIDKKNCKKYGPCGVGKRAIYLNSFYIDRMYYIPFSDIKRVYKRIAMSKGGFNGKGLFASLSYLVVEYGDGKEKQCNFKHEEHVDALLSYLEETFPELPLHSVEAERKLKEKEAALAAKKERIASSRAKTEILELEHCRSYLENHASLSEELSASAKRKRAFEQSNPTYKWVALFIVLIGLAAFLYGIYSLITHAGFAMYFLLFGLAAIFLFSSANVLPTAKNNKKYITKRFNTAVDEMQQYISAYEHFPLPAYYAHPAVCSRMIGILADERAKSIPEALAVLKKDLKAMNASVELELEDYEEVIAIKPMFLIQNYE